MARIRTIKPEFWSSPGVTAMNPWARLTFIAMWNWADDFGRGTYEPRELMGFVFPREDDMTVAEFRTHVYEIHTHVGVVFYEVDGRRYFEVTSWEKHQRSDPRLKQSKFPGPEEGNLIDPLTLQVKGGAEEAHTHVDVLHTHVDGAQQHVRVGTGEQGNSGTGIKDMRNPDGLREHNPPQTPPQPSPQTEVRPEADTAGTEPALIPEPEHPVPEPEKKPAKRKRHTYSEDFEKFWGVYPTRKGKREAYKAWKNAIKRADPETIIAGAHRYATDPNRSESYTKWPQGWLNGDRWEDDPLPPRDDGQRQKPVTDLDVYLARRAGMGQEAPQRPSQWIDGTVVDSGPRMEIEARKSQNNEPPF